MAFLFKIVPGVLLLMHLGLGREATLDELAKLHAF
jgi:hypothetical protein